ncbi:amino acid adenylation domain-containing protein [Flavobacteriaceae bacterium M23B6Z8]
MNTKVDYSNILQILETATDQGISLYLDEGKLKLKLKKDEEISQELLAQIKTNKDEIIDFLSNEYSNFKKLNEKVNKVKRANYAEIKEIPLSFSQERLWFLDQLQGSIEYHIPLLLELKGDVDVHILESALKQIVDRHEILRTSIQSKNGSPYQVIRSSSDWSLVKKSAASKVAIESEINTFVSTPFDLANDYMFRARLFKIASTNYILAGVLHHIASDGWSNAILTEEFISIYKSLKSGTKTSLPELSLQYTDYAIWQRNYLRPEELDAQLSYWKDQLQQVPVLELPTDFPRPANQSTSGAALTFRLKKDTSEALHIRTKENDVTLFMTLMTAFKILLYKYTGERDICVGTPVANRTQEALENLIGYFVNTLAIRSELGENTSFLDLLAQVKKTTLEAYDHQAVPFEKIVEHTVEDREMSVHPIFQVMFALQNNPNTSSEIDLDGMEIAPYYLENKTAKFDITLIAVEETDGIALELEYCTDIFKEATIERMIEHFNLLLEQIVKDPTARISGLGIVTEAEAKKLLVDFNATSVDFPAAASVVTQFESQVQETPSHAAVVTSESTLTYEAMDAYTNQLARYLQDKGLAHGDLAGVKLGRGTGLVSSVLGVLKTGAGYVAIDPEYPSARIDYMESDSGCKWVIDADFLEDFEKVRASYAATSLATPIKTGDLAYVIYTSGSTGTPKGVKISHGNLLNLCNWHKDLYKLSPSSRGTLFSGTGFDASVWEIYPYLLSGASLYPLPNTEERYDLSFLSNFLEDHQITHAYLPSQVCQDLVNEELSIAGLTILTGGDALHLSKPSRVKIYNNYGPTENTVVTTYYEVQDGEAGMIPIGYPISNTQVYVLSDGLQLQPVGVVGELCISGASLSSGYLNQEVLTEEKFVANPFVEGEKIYRTGDLARWRADGSLIFCGRKDSQVKIRGYRIELGEIEYAIQDQDGIQQAAVLAKEDAQGQKRLVGYVVSSVDFEKTAIEASLEKTLPTYMIPKQWVVLESLPLNQNGKVDKRKLDSIEVELVSSNEYIAPENQIEAELAYIWEQLLGCDKIGVRDDFFALGGHSLLATRLVAAIKNELDVQISIRSIFTHRILEHLANHIEQKDHEIGIPEISKQDATGRIPLSFSQERLWFIDQLQGGRQYHIPVIFEMNGGLQTEILEETLQQIIERHEILRTVYKSENGIAYQEIQDAQDWTLQFHQIDENSELEAQIASFFEKPFDLTKDYMFRACLFSLDNAHHVFAGVFHHIASDGWSEIILTDEFIKIYNQKLKGDQIELPKLEIQYADYAIWQRKYLEGAVFENELKYWENQLQNAAPLKLPTDYARPALQSTAGAMVKYQIDKSVLKQLKVQSENHGVTLYMLLLTVFKIVLYKYSGQEDLSVGTPVANRINSKIEGLIGFFINNLVLRSTVTAETTFDKLLAQVKETTLGAYDHQQVPFEKVVERVVGTRDMSINPLFQVKFMLDNTPGIGKEIDMHGVAIKPYETAHTISIIDLSWNLQETEEGLFIGIEYCTDLFKETTISRMVSHFETLLHQVIENPYAKVSSLNLLSEQEKYQLKKFNKSEVKYERNLTIISVFEEQVKNRPETTAVVYNDEKLSYEELNKRANRLAHYLKDQYDLKEDELVGVMMHRSLWSVISILGILKAGAAYLPIDIDYPETRKSFILDDAGLKLLIIESESLFDMMQFEVPQLSIDIEFDTFPENKEVYENIPAIINPSSLAYVIYTSGSTGTPKGVMIEHQGIMNTILAQIDIFGIEKEDHCIQFASHSFDASVSEIFTALVAGASLYLIDDTTKKDIEAFTAYIQENNITIATIPPAFLRLLDVEILAKSLKTLVTAGEAAPKEKVVAFMENGGNYINAYGPTETSICATTFQGALENTTVPIGKPIWNTKIYMLATDGSLQPIGIPGELCIAGTGLARGYLNRDLLTNEKFIPNPYDKTDLLYKTGDLAKWLPEGNIEFLGRIDDQVKVRGYRIELGEIESVVNTHPEIHQSAVVTKTQTEDQQALVGYYQRKKQVKLLASLSEYFVYDDLAYHALTTDNKRNNYYKRVFKRYLKDKVVLDIGTGPEAILSQFCLEAGAKKVYAVEISKEVYEKAKKTVEKLGLSDKIILINDDITNVDLPEEVDYCVSEIVGPIGGSEGSAKLINLSRRLLNKPENMIPKRSLTKIAGVNFPDELHNFQFDEIGKYYVERIFDQVGYKFDLRICVEDFPLENILTNNESFEDLDYTRPLTLEDSHSIKLTFEKDSVVTGFIVWLNLYIDDDQVIDTLSERYSWLPVYLPVFYNDTKVSKGDYIEAVIHRTLSDNNLNPDFTIEGNLFREGFEAEAFTFTTSNHEKKYRHTPFYDRLFKDDSIHEGHQKNNLTQDIVTYLKGKLPDYMVPEIWMEVDKLPINTSGKIDKKALPDPDESQVSTVAYVAPRNEFESKLAEIWKNLLNVEKIGVFDNFFRLGGHSLLATQLVSVIRKELDVELPIRSIFEHPSLADLASFISNSGAVQGLPEIFPQERPDTIPLSFSQERLWFLDNLKGSVAYHLPFVLKIEGTPDTDLIAKSLATIIDRHEILRTVYGEQDGIGYQEVISSSDWSLTREEVATEAALESSLESFINHPFDLGEDYMFRACLYRVAGVSGRYVLAGVFHHIASDGWSNGILVSEFTELYRSLADGESANLPSLPIQYGDYALWQRSYLEGEVLEQQLQYWEDQLGDTSVLSLPTDYPRPSVQSTRGASLRFSLSESLSASLEALSKREGTTLFMTLLAGFKVLLYRYTGQDDICVGTPIANRTQKELEGLIGFFVNTLALRSDLGGNPSFRELLHQVKQTTLDSYDHQLAPFEKVVDRVVTTRDMSVTPVFQIMFGWQNTPETPELEVEGIQLSAMDAGAVSSKFDMTITAAQVKENIIIDWEYCTDLYSEQTITRMKDHFEQLLEAFVANAEQPIGDVSLVSEKARQQLLKDFNATAVAYPSSVGLMELFSAQVSASGTKTALVYGTAEMSYEALDISSGRVASYLLAKGITPGSRVGILSPRSMEMIISMLGILKAGGVYVPLDPSLPQDRLSFIASDAGLELIIGTDSDLTGAYAFKEIPVFDYKETLSYEPLGHAVTVSPDAGAYVMYTSGTTGKPKGILITHKNISSLVFGSAALQVYPEDRVLQWSNYAFDGSTYEIYGSLLHGARLYIIPQQAASDAQLLVDTIYKNDVSVLFITTALFNSLAEYGLDKLKSIRKLLFGGEKVSVSHVEKAFDALGAGKVVHVYGPTETTTYVTSYTVEDKTYPTGTVPIGAPLANTSIYILDTQDQLVPVGVIGELCIGGTGVSQGYLNRAELNSEKFVKDPFRADPDARMYRTGDLARWLPDGNIAFVGRADSQVKIRGYRIELGEIETLLLQQASVQRCCVTAWEDAQGTKRLVGYVVSEQEIDKSALQDSLGTHLPDYMVPRLWVGLDALPLTRNGKIDYGALPAPETDGLSGEAYVAPESEAEQALATIWQELLGVAKVGVHDNFFDLGGDSIITIQVVSRLKRYGYHLKPKDIFENQTIAKLSVVLETSTAIQGEQGILEGNCEMTPIQHHYFENIHREDSHFNQSVLLSIDKSVSEEELTKAFEIIVKQHDSLRFEYKKDEKEWQQLYTTSIENAFKIEDISNTGSTELAEKITTICRRYQEAIKISDENNFKAILIKTPDNASKNRLFIVAHHLIIDGVSWRILIDDIEIILTNLLFNGEYEPPAKGTSYREWVAILKDYAVSKSVVSKQKYWSTIANHYQQIPVDKEDGLSVMSDVSNYEIILDEQHTQKLLKEVHQAYGTEMDDILVGCLAHTLSSWTHMNHLVVGMEGHGREQLFPEIDLSNTIGWFTNLYPVLLPTTRQESIGGVIKSAKETLRSVPDKGMGYGALRYLHPSEEIRKNLEKVKWDVIFNYLGQLDQVVKSDSILDEADEFTGANIGANIPFTNKMEVNCNIIGGRLVMNWSYSKKQYYKETIAEIAIAYIENLKEIITHCSEKTTREFTASDYGLKDVDQKELENFINEKTDSEELFKF